MARPLGSRSSTASSTLVGALLREVVGDLRHRGEVHRRDFATDEDVAAESALASPGPATPLRRLLGRAERSWRVVVGLPRFSRGWRLYADDRSRAVLVKLLAYRLLGRRFVPLPMDPQAYWASYEVARAQQPLAPAREGGAGMRVAIFDLRPFGYEITARCRQGGIFAHCLLKQYELHRNGDDVDVREGDVVIDGGAAWGETALIFAAKAGKTGRVVSAEVGEDVLPLFRENLELNPDLAAGMELEESLLWNESDRTLSFSAGGPSGRVDESGPSSGTTSFHTVSIDDLVERRQLPRVDFIKLDVEGSERAVLEGAVKSLRAWRPRLAISAYHRPFDLVDIAAQVNSIVPGYRFYLDHFTDFGEETVLFATADPPA